MGENRIYQVKDIVEAGFLINKQFKSYFPVPLRGAITSIGEPIDLSYKSEGRIINLQIKNIDSLLNEGTELNYDDAYGLTRVDYYPSAVNWAFVYAKDRGRIDFWAKRAGISKEITEFLKPIIIVYNPEFLTKASPERTSNIFNVFIPRKPEDRAKAILGIYVNNTMVTCDWSETPF